MQRTALAALVCLLALAACDQAIAPKAQYRPERPGTVDNAMCQLGFTAVPLREAVTGHHLVDVTLNGRPATFVLDTGANASVIHAPFAEQFGLTASRGMSGAAVGLGGSMSVGQSRLETLRVGSVEVRQGRIATADLSQLVNVLGRLSNRQVSGILGQDVMKTHHAVIDVAGPILYLMVDPKRPAPVSAAACTAPAEAG